MDDIKDETTPLSPTKMFTPPFKTRGRHIVDSTGRRVKLASINWYGANDIYFVAGGLDFRHRDEIAATIVKLGFNSVRFPYSDQMVIENPRIPAERIAANLDLLGDEAAAQRNEKAERKLDELQGPSALTVFNACVQAMTAAGLMVIINNHSTNAHWCDGKNLCDSSWKNDHLGPLCKIRQTTASWIANWQTVMRPFIDDPLVMAADLRNEPRGLWGTMTWNAWASAAEQCSEALLSMQPAWLMIVEGVSSANDCSGARNRPVVLSVPDRVVYSSHVYSWSGWSTLTPYSKRAYASFAKDMQHNWAFLLDQDIAPVWVGEFGAPHHGDEGQHHYWNNLMRILRETDADFGFWALNPRKPAGNQHESYRLLEDDWETPVEDWRLKDLRALTKSEG